MLFSIANIGQAPGNICIVKQIPGIPGQLPLSQLDFSVLLESNSTLSVHFT